ncbi:hypothetical protein C8J56DRAFT_894934 [Mycena floridula]|nr:hypothetical protein C8J56DRAFT_894934 [Mycena floridula]
MTRKDALSIWQQLLERNFELNRIQWARSQINNRACTNPISWQRQNQVFDLASLHKLDNSILLPLFSKSKPRKARVFKRELSSPVPTDQVPEPDELAEDDDEPVIVKEDTTKKGGKPSKSPAPAPKSPIDEAHASLAHGQSHLHLAVYRELIEAPEPRHPLSPSKLDLLQLGTDDLHYWGYVIDIMYRQLFVVSNPVQQVALITTIAVMFQQQNDFAIANACQEMDFPETSYIFQLCSAVM